MSELHLTKGSIAPPKEEGKLRLYSMKFCPYAQRARLVLKTKGIPHDIVNIDLINKPEWYFNIHSEGKVPALDTGSKVIVESLDICEYLEEHYPEKSLYPTDSEAKQQDKDLIKKINPLTVVFAKCVFGQEKKTPGEWVEQFNPHIAIFEDELARRKTPYFRGDKPGMVDYMLWPWGERASVTSIALGEKLPFGDNQFPLIRKWKKLMRADSVVDEIYNGPEKFWKVVLFKLKQEAPDYDEI